MPQSENILGTENAFSVDSISHFQVKDAAGDAAGSAKSAAGDVKVRNFPSSDLMSAASLSTILSRSLQRVHPVMTAFLSTGVCQERLWRCGWQPEEHCRRRPG